MKLAAAVILSFAVAAIVFAEDHPAMKEVKLPIGMAGELGRTDEQMDPEPKAMRRGGGGKGKGESAPAPGWGPPMGGWGGPPVGWGPPPVAPMVIPIPMMGWGGGLRGGY